MNFCRTFSLCMTFLVGDGMFKKLFNIKDRTQTVSAFSIFFPHSSPMHDYFHQPVHFYCLFIYFFYRLWEARWPHGKCAGPWID